MLYSPPSTQPAEVVRKTAVNSIWVIFSSISAWHRKSAQRRALRSLLQYDAHMLEDLGINRSDLFDAFDEPSWAAHGLDLRRARRATSWLPPR
jgi:uncharacterized protein YjiS (DUF1127 family)